MLKEGVAARHQLVRPAPRSRGGDPKLAAGGPTKRKRTTTTGGQRQGHNARPPAQPYLRLATAVGLLPPRPLRYRAVAPAWPLPPLPLPPLPSPPARPPLRRAKCRLDARGLACDARMRGRPRDCCRGGRTAAARQHTSSIHARGGRGGGERGTSRKTWYGTAGMGTGNKISAYRGSKTPGGAGTHGWTGRTHRWKQTNLSRKSRT